MRLLTEWIIICLVFITEQTQPGKCPSVDMDSPPHQMMGTCTPDTRENILRPETLISTNCHRKTSAIIDAFLPMLNKVKVLHIVMYFTALRLLVRFCTVCFNPLRSHTTDIDQEREWPNVPRINNCHFVHRNKMWRFRLQTECNFHFLGQFY